MNYKSSTSLIKSGVCSFSLAEEISNAGMMGGSYLCVLLLLVLSKERSAIVLEFVNTIFISGCISPG